MEKISIILPTYNCANTIRVALESIIDQDYEKKELIVCDGASTDETLRIIEDYRDHISILISEPDKGIYDAMNKGAEKASGQWLYFLGADDRLLNKCVLSDIFSRIDTTKFDFIYGNILLGNTSRIYSGSFNFFKLLRENICHQAIFIRKSLLAELGGFDLRYPLLADWDVNLKIWYNRKVKKIYLNQVIACFGMNGTSSRIDYSAEAESVTQQYSRKKAIYLFKRVLDLNSSSTIFDVLR